MEVHGVDGDEKGIVMVVTKVEMKVLASNVNGERSERKVMLVKKGSLK